MQSGNYGYDPNRTFDGDTFTKNLEIVSDSIEDYGIFDNLFPSLTTITSAAAKSLSAILSLPLREPLSGIGKARPPRSASEQRIIKNLGPLHCGYERCGFAPFWVCVCCDGDAF